MLVFCLVAVFAISTSVAEQTCSYRLTPDSNIIGGAEAPVTGLGACQTYCTSFSDCQGFDFDPSSGKCWTLKTQSGVQSNKGIQHYDKSSCYTIETPAPPPPPPPPTPPPPRDLVSRVGDPRCFKTNYQGPVTDLWTAPNGVNWNFQIAHFGFDWPQSGILFLPLSSLVFIEEISFKSSDNLDYFRVVLTQNNGKTITTRAIGPNDHSTALSNANDIKRVDFYLAPVDFRRNVTLNDINLKACTGVLFLRECTIFNLLKDLIMTASLGILRPGGSSGTFSASVAPDFPFVELDLNCAGIGTVNFNSVSFGRTSNFNYVVIGVWDGAAVVPIFNSDGVAGSVFNNAQGINLGSSVRGNRIRATIIPSGVSDQGTSGSIWFSKYSVLAV